MRVASFAFRRVSVAEGRRVVLPCPLLPGFARRLQSVSSKNCRIYVALFPCNECAKLIIQSRVTEVVYCSDRYHATESMTASRRMLSLANVKTRRFSSTNRIDAIDFNNVDPA